jgi:uncharacterized membrane protein
MLSPGSCALSFALVIGLLIAGIYLVRNPERVFRRFSFGQVETRFGVGFFRVVGWFYIAGGAIGVLMLVVAAVLLLIHSH